MFRSRITHKLDQVPRDTLVWIFVAQAFAIIPLFFYLPLWLPVFWLFVMVWRIQIFRGVWSFPRTAVKAVLGALSVGLLLFSFRGQMGVEPMVSFLLCGFILKLIEIYKRSDATILLYICFFSLAAQFLFSQTILTTVFVLLALVVLVTALRSLYVSREAPLNVHLKSGAVLVFQSVPLMLVLFVVMPRLGQIWAVPTLNDAATTGFSDSMSPGTMSNLIKSRELAFRVTFEPDDKGELHLPAPKERYWRGLVLEYFDGITWRQNAWGSRSLVGRVQRWSDTPDQWNTSVSPSSDVFRYSIILEPHNHTWLFGLMTPTWMQAPQQLGAGFHESTLLVSRRPVSSRVQYQLESAVDYKIDADGLSAELRQRNLRLPQGVNPRVDALVEQWKKDLKNEQDFIDTALQFYNQSFTYTLNPPRLGSSSVDDFLFITRRGFCEHFASSFVYLMRSAGIPARVVVGYQGGELNSVENYFMVRQSDAHAWAEVWLQEQGWVRVDPTAAVAPLRIEQNLESAVDQGEAKNLAGRFNFARLALLRDYWDVLGYKWHSMVLSYDDERQKNIFERFLGGTQAWRIGLWFIACCAILLLALLAFLLLGKQAVVLKAENKVYRRFLRKLAKLGVERKLGETPQRFAERACLQRPELSKPIALITDLYCRIAYRRQDKFLKALTSEVARFPR